jgi:hypothetical protein
MKVLVLLSVLLASTWAYSQDDAQPEVPYEYAEYWGYANVIKWDVGMIGRGTFMLNYERMLLPAVSAEIGAGITYSDFMFFGRETLKKNIDYSDRYGTRKSYGPALAARIKIYPRIIDDMQGVYLSFGGQWRQYRSYAKLPEERLVVNNTLGADFCIGWQVNSESVSGLSADFFFGLGIRDFKAQYYTKEIEADKTLRVLKINRPVLLAGLRLGLPF